jgi:hypothetical protein
MVNKDLRENPCGDLIGREGLMDIGLYQSTNSSWHLLERTMMRIPCPEAGMEVVNPVAAALNGEQGDAYLELASRYSTLQTQRNHDFGWPSKIM